MPSNEEFVIKNIKSHLHAQSFEEMKSFSASMGRSYLPVQKVGSYECSIARSLDDLIRINPNVFEVADNIRELLEKNYPQGFGCKKPHGQ